MLQRMLKRHKTISSVCSLFECGNRKCSNGEESEKKEKTDRKHENETDTAYIFCLCIMTYFLQENPMNEENLHSFNSY